MKSILHFSHANGFPGGSYQVVLDALNQHYDVRATDRIGHSPNYPVTNNWPNLEREMIEFFEQNYSEPVIAVGHSLGGILSLRLAYKRSDLVKAVIVLDVPALSAFEAKGLRLLKVLGMMDKVTPASRMDGRRALWHDQAEAIEYFRGKKLMRQFDERCLADYVRAGTEPCDGGICLHFDPKVEQSIYRTIPDNLVLKKPLAVPAAVIGGEGSAVFNKNQGARMRRQLKMKLRWLPGTHMFPLEYPEQTATVINELLEEMLSIQ